MSAEQATAHAGPSRLTFDRMRVQVDVTFWMEMRARQVSEWQLDEPTVPLTGTATAVTVLERDDTTALTSSSAASDANSIVFSRESFLPEARGGGGGLGDAAFVRGVVPGELKTVGVLQRLTNLDCDAALFTVLREKLLEPLVLAPLLLSSPSPSSFPTTDAAAAEEEEEEEARRWRTSPFLFFVMYAYVDAKNYAFHHQEAFPVMSVDSPLFVEEAGGGDGTRGAALLATVAEAIERHSVCRARTYSASCLWSPFLCTVEEEKEDGGKTATSVTFAEFSPSRYARFTRECAGTSRRVMICFRDLAASASTLGWPMRNFLLCLRLLQPSLTRLSLVAIRGGGGGRGGSVCVECSCEPLANGADMVDRLRTAPSSSPPEFLRLTGWRKTSVHVADISTHMNPTSLAEEGSRLNLELMKWRQLPGLDLAGLAGCRALLLGAGTLGCNVARSLLMWGVRRMTLVDRGTVHYSNLARQSLFTAADAAAKDREKSVAAADALRAIIPSVEAVAVTMTIHMPGHRTDPAHTAQTCAELERLDELIRTHDVVFLLTDSREARWLPTVLAAAHDTPLLNVALGFDSYVVMRHGLAGDDVRCYFCSDVTAPTDSVSERALDQQCTVTRPGVSGVASSLAVELLAAMYQQDPPFGKRRPAGTKEANEPVAQHSRLGVVPEQIRGSVYTHSTTLLTGKRNPNCTACSRGVLEAYAREGSAFLLRCINDPSHIETVSGLGASKALWEAQDAADDWSCHTSSEDGDGDDA